MGGFLLDNDTSYQTNPLSNNIGAKLFDFTNPELLSSLFLNAESTSPSGNMGGASYPTQDFSDPSQKLYFQLRSLQLVTMWYDFEGKPKVYTSLFKILYGWNIIILALATVALFAKVVTTDDLVDRSEAIDIFTLTGSALYKMVFFFQNHVLFVDMVNCGLALTKHLPVGWTKNCKLFSLVHCIAGFITMFFWGLCPILKWLFGEVTLSEMKLPMNAQDPFDSQGFLFVANYCVCHYALILSAQIYMAADGFLFTSIYLGIGALTTLRKMVKDMGKYDENRYKIAEFEHDALEKLKECVKLQVHCLDYIRKIDKLFRSMILADVLHAIISLSFAMLQASESKGILESMKMTIFIFVCFAHQFLNSFFGQQLTNAQDNMQTQMKIAIPWVERAQAFKKSYLIMVTANKYSVQLSAWSVYVLQYATFMEFSRSMVSYYMILRQLQDEAVGVQE